MAVSRSKEQREALSRHKSSKSVGCKWVSFDCAVGVSKIDDNFVSARRQAYRHRSIDSVSDERKKNALSHRMIGDEAPPTLGVGS